MCVKFISFKTMLRFIMLALIFSCTLAENINNTLLRELFKESESRSLEQMQQLLNASETRSMKQTQQLLNASEARSLEQMQQLLNASEARSMKQTLQLLNATELSFKTFIRDESHLFLKNGVKRCSLLSSFFLLIVLLGLEFITKA